MRIAFFSHRWHWNAYAIGRSMFETLGLMGPKVEHFGCPGDPSFDETAFDEVWIVSSEVKIPETTLPLIVFGLSDPQMFDKSRFERATTYYSMNQETSRKYSVHYWPAFADERYFQPLGVQRMRTALFTGYGKHDIVPERPEMAAALREAGVQLKVYGSGWPTHPMNRKPIYGKDLIWTLNGAKLCVDFTNDNPSVSSRIFQALLCELPVLTYDRPEVREMFEPEVEIMLYRDIAEMVSKTQDFLANGDPEMGKRGRERCLRDHTPRRRLEVILRGRGKT